jgi:integrase
VAGHYRALSVWCAWLVKRGTLPDHPMRTIPRPKQPRHRIAYITPAELSVLLGAISTVAWSDVRDQALLRLLFYSGLRVGEAVALYAGEVDMHRRVLLVRRAKGGSARLVPFADEVAPPLLEYLYRRPPWPGPELWLSNDGYGGVRGLLTTEGVRQMLRRRCKAAGMRYINPHAFRHGFAMWTLNAGMELSAVSAAMGHSSTQITQSTYARWLPAGLQREYTEAYARLRSHND